MIRRWNAVVQPADRVYHLGDFTLNDYAFARSIFKQLNGRVTILNNRWHHDKRWIRKAVTAPPHTNGTEHFHARAFVYLLPPMDVIEIAREVKQVPPLTGGPRPLKVTLSHYPMASWEASYHGAWHLHGHSHNQYDGGGFMLDVGVDRWDFAPVSLREVRTFMATREGEKHARQGG